MKKFSFFAMIAAVAASFATPAMAADPTFTGARIEVTAGVDDVTNARGTSDITYGAAVGLDAPVFGDVAVLGVEASVDNVFERKDVAASVRLGIPAGRVLPYVKAGYANFRDLNGVRVGGGLEYAVTNNLYSKAEYRYSDLENGVGRHQALVGLGIRF